MTLKVYISGNSDTRVCNFQSFIATLDLPQSRKDSGPISTRNSRERQLLRASWFLDSPSNLSRVLTLFPHIPSNWPERQAPAEQAVYLNTRKKKNYTKKKQVNEWKNNWNKFYRHLCVVTVRKIELLLRYERVAHDTYFRSDLNINRIFLWACWNFFLQARWVLVMQKLISYICKRR